MQAYKGLYEDQLQSQHASAESYRSLTRGYSRLSADNKALRRETAAAAAAVSDAAAWSADGLMTSSADKQPTTGGVLSPFPAASAAAASRDRTGRPGKKEHRDSARGGGGGDSGVGAEVSAGAVPPAACSAAAPAGDGSDSGDAGRAYAVTAAESAAAVATAATAVAAAADALAEATTSALPSASLIRKEGDHDAAAAGERDNPDRNLGIKRVGVGSSNCNSSGSGSISSRVRDRTVASGYGSAEAERPSTAETLACSPYSDAADGTSSSATEKPVTATAAEKRANAAGDAAGDGGGWAPTTEYCSAAGEAPPRRNGDPHRGHTAKGYAFPQTTGQEECPCPVRGGGGVSSAGAAASPPQTCGQDPTQKGGGAGASVPDEGRSATLRGVARAGRLAKAVRPAEPAPRWRGRSTGPSRLLASSASWAEAGDVEAPKRSNSPPPPRRGRWGECVTSGAWGGGGVRGDGCSRIEPSARTRPHSI